MQHIGISGGNHVLRRSLVDACERAGHRATIVDEHLRGAVSGDGAEVEPPGANPVGIDSAIVIDPSLVPGDSQATERTSSEPLPERLRHCNRIVFAYSSRSERGTAVLGAQSNDGQDLVTVRSAPIYGIASDAVTLFLIMMRSFPAVPVLSDDRRAQLIWKEDLARALVSVATLPGETPRQVLDVAGPEAVTHDQLYEHIATLIDRRPLRIPVPDFLARHGSRLSDVLGLTIHLDAALDTFFAPNVGDNALESLLGESPTPLVTGLRRLIVDLDEITPAQGVGSVQVKHFRADIHASTFTRHELLQMFRERFAEIMPIPVNVEPAVPAARLEEGATLTMTLPGRGHVQVRVQEVTPDHVIVATLRGHAIAGVVRFSVDSQPSSVRFEVSTCDAAANALDWLTLSLGGARVQDANWTRVVQKMTELSGGTSDGVATTIRTLTADEAANAEHWIRDVIATSHRRH